MYQEAEGKKEIDQKFVSPFCAKPPNLHIKGTVWQGGVNKGMLNSSGLMQRSPSVGELSTTNCFLVFQAALVNTDSI